VKWTDHLMCMPRLLSVGMETGDGTIYRIVSNIAILRSYRGMSLSR